MQIKEPQTFVTYYKYNAHNDITQIIQPLFGNIFLEKTLKYKYDNKGNWIERVEYNNSEEELMPKFITIKAIDYY